ILLEPMGHGIRGVTLRFAHEMRGADEYFGSILEMVLPAEMLKLAEHIIKTKGCDFDASMLEDHCRTAFVEILRKKQAQLPPHVGPVSENGVNLMDAVRRALSQDRVTGGPATVHDLSRAH